MASVLVSWIGADDLGASTGSVSRSRIHRVVEGDFYSSVLLLSHYKKKESRSYRDWLAEKSSMNVELDRRKLDNLYDFSEILLATSQALEECIERIDEDVEFAFVLGSDSPMLDAILVMLAHARYDAELIAWHDEEVVMIDVLAEDMEKLIEQAARRRARHLPFSEMASFDTIVGTSVEMQRVVESARVLAEVDVPVLLSGERGTAREVLARAIHKESDRAAFSFVVCDAEATSSGSQEEVIFGGTQRGLIQRANGGTLFIDGVEKLSNAAQATLFHTMREGRLAQSDGGWFELDVRIMASTEVSPERLLGEGLLREDLFYRIAIGILDLPTIRERVDDLDHILEFLLDRIRKDLEKELTITDEARAAIHAYPWPGNIRELNSTLRRAAVWTETIDAGDVSRALIRFDEHIPPAERSFDGDFSIQEVLDDVARHHLRRALQKTDGNKTRAAEMLGLNNYQTLTNWMKRLGVESP